MINNECNVDFVDLNVGCPIDGIVDKGMGSALMTRANRLVSLGYTMNNVLDTPFTIKMRMGCKIYIILSSLYMF